MLYYIILYHIWKNTISISTLTREIIVDIIVAIIMTIIATIGLEYI